mmetsp:Transcript_2188/g.8566  ORF Transcript_2188/g.8566 Transcript_2188/m.8566 type:complete len:209 (+) Transcript_2188:1600-2226(+)
MATSSATPLDRASRAAEAESATTRTSALGSNPHTKNASIVFNFSGTPLAGVPDTLNFPITSKSALELAARWSRNHRRFSAVSCSGLNHAACVTNASGVVSTNSSSASSSAEDDEQAVLIAVGVARDASSTTKSSLERSLVVASASPRAAVPENVRYSASANHPPRRLADVDPDSASAGALCARASLPSTSSLVISRGASFASRDELER